MSAELTLAAWLAEQGHANPLAPLSGDAGFRRYFRLQDSSPSLMGVFAPPATENTPAYLHVSQLLKNGGVRVPEVVAVDVEQGLLLVEDCGSRQLLPELTDASVNAHYHRALQMMLQMQQIPVEQLQLPAYDGQKLWDEMALFPSWFVQNLLDLPCGNNEQTMLNNLFDCLIDSALQQPQAFVHRDFHARNLMLLDGDELVTIDFQDAVVGPVTYDLVSILRDCYIHWPLEQVESWALDYLQLAQAAGLYRDISNEQWLRYFDMMGLQRHIKVLGIFARLWLRDGKAGYLNDLPLVLHYTLSVARRLPCAQELVEWLEMRIIPACRRQPWFKAVGCLA